MNKVFFTLLAAISVLTVAACTTTTGSTDGAASSGDVITGGDLNLDGYSLVWEDNFDGPGLNRNDWNVELHEPGWVNAELQEYVDSEENIFFENGNLVIRPVKSTVNGKIHYTSGRISTQNKRDFTYGVFEARLKVPEGKGFLPAFWLMATDENVYGQWPRCGEIDIMEVHGSDTRTTYGTIHYGNPHRQSQATRTLRNGTFADSFHTFAVKWEPGEISWYVDGFLIHRENDWYSVTEGQGEITYPAPFDQPFYIILNLAVGGSWVGYPDRTTDFKNARYEVDYVKVWQKENYDENVTKPEKEVVLRAPDEKSKQVLADGNYIYNGKFQEGNGRLGFWEIENNGAAIISVTDFADGRRLSIDGGNIRAANPLVLRQSGLALTEGAYAFSADIEGNAGSTVLVKAGDESFPVVLEEGRKTYSRKFSLASPGGRSVSLTFSEPGNYLVDNIVLTEDSLIRNGSFNAGFSGFEPYAYTPDDVSWVVDSLSENNAADFTIKDTGPQAWHIQLKQSGICLEKGQSYRLSFDAKSSVDRKIMFAIQRDGSKHNDDWTPYSGEKIVPLTSEYQTFSLDFTMNHDTDDQSVFSLSMGAVDGKRISKQHRICIDNIILEKTGSGL